MLAPFISQTEVAVQIDTECAIIFMIIYSVGIKKYL